MYGFKLTLENMDDFTRIEKLIEVEEQFFETEKEVFTYAMGKAYNEAIIRNDYTFISLELLYC